LVKLINVDVDTSYVTANQAIDELNFVTAAAATCYAGFMRSEEVTYEARDQSKPAALRKDCPPTSIREFK
jgi:hypothetical protein